MSRGVADPGRAPPDSKDTTPKGQEVTYRNFWPHRVIRRVGAVRALPPHPRSLADLTFEVGDVRFDISDYMTRRRTDGLLILKRGEIALERYGSGSGPDRHRTGYSTAKSITSTLVGAALHEGAIGSLDDRCDLYLPRLRGSAYEGVTIRNAMRMCSGVAWSDQDDARPDSSRLHQALVSRQPGSVLDLLCTLQRARPQGGVFNYSTIESCLLGALVAAATGRKLADYCAEMIWGPAGMEADGYWALEAEDGLELGGAGVSARLRDVARFGLLVLEDGEAFSGRRVLPPGWRDLAGQPDSAPTAFGRLMPGSPVGYGYQWWALPHLPTGIHAGAFVAIGARGQYIYLNPAEQVVIAIQSAWRQHRDSDAEAETFRLMEPRCVRFDRTCDRCGGGSGRAVAPEVGGVSPVAYGQAQRQPRTLLLNGVNLGLRSLNKGSRQDHRRGPKRAPSVGSYPLGLHAGNELRRRTQAAAQWLSGYPGYPRCGHVAHSVGGARTESGQGSPLHSTDFFQKADP